MRLHDGDGRINRMNRDELTYSRATTAALAGLAVQIVLCVATGLIGAWAQSPAIQAATWHIAGGIPIWIILAIIYQQHRVERTESLAAEKLATQDATSAAIFGETSDELQLSRNRLDRLYAYGLPAVSFAVAIYLIAAGAAMLYRVAGLGTDKVALSLAKDCNPVGLMFATAGVAFVAFIAARWISGYTRVREWQLLRGGASYLMSTFLVAALLFAGAAAVAIVKETTFFEWLARLVPWMMILVGSEILLTALLAAYRPKRPGEIPRPAFDSRFLGLLTAPESLGQVVGELINYQFGVEVSRSWFYQMLGRAVTPLTVFAGAVLLALSTLVIVGPDEQGTVLRFGALARGPLGPGMHLKAPWPLETSEIYPTGKVLQLQISSDKLGRFGKKREGLLWTGGDDDAAKMGLEFFLCASETGEGSGSSLSLLVADVIVQYRIGDLVKFLEGSTSARESIELVTQQEASNYFAGKTLEELLSRGRTEGGPELQKRIQARVDALGLGFEIVDVGVTTLQPPPGKVAREFHRQIGAQQERETLVQLANKDAIKTLAKVAGSVDRSRKINEAIIRLDDSRTAAAEAAAKIGAREILPLTAQQLAKQELEIEELLGEARGEAAEIIHKARSDRWKKTIGERSALERFAGQLLAYQAAPAYFRTKQYLEVLANSLVDRRKVVIAGDKGDLPVLNLDFSDPTNAIDTLIGE
jgi:regulator of protease activity HflC (stomatin/prohibitin superfamily)